MPLTEKYQSSPRVEITAQGRLLVVKAVGLDRELRLGGGRGDVTVFSSGSRMRLLRKLARISPTAVNGFRHSCTFLTLTTRAIHHPRQFKEFMRAMFKRLGRKAPRLAAVWRLEYQKRGAPHLHIILYNMPFVDKVWIQDAWGEIVSQDKPFTRIESIRSYKHLMSYASKYCAKVASCGFNTVTYQAVGVGQEKYGHLSPGRVWGVYNKNCLPFEHLQEAVIPLDGSWWMLRRYCCKFYPWVWEGDEGGFTVFTDDPYHALEHMVSMSSYFVNAAW